MLSQFEVFAKNRGGAPARPGEEPAAAAGKQSASAPGRGSAKPAGGAPEADIDRHSLRLTTAYGDLVAAEEVSGRDYGAALRRFHDEAVTRANAVVVLDGVMHTRNSFLEFVREFNDCMARQRSLGTA